MGRKTVGRKTVGAFSMPNLILYNIMDRGRVIFLDFQGFYRRVGSSINFSIRRVETATLGLEVEEVLPLKLEMLDCSKRALIRMFLREILDISNCTPQIAIVMSDFEGSSNSMTSEQVEINALKEEGFGDNTPAQASPVNSSSSGGDSSDLPSAIFLTSRCQTLFESLLI